MVQVEISQNLQLSKHLRIHADFKKANFLFDKMLQNQIFKLSKIVLEIFSSFKVELATSTFKVDKLRRES
jgi:hypothetical protein